MNSLMTIENVRGYLDPANGTAYLNAEDVARGFGFTQTKNGAEYIRWETVNGYLRGFGFSQHVGKDNFLPENMVYRLGFKASNETAQKFQALLADEVIPAIRKTGGYISGVENLSDDEIMAKALLIGKRTIEQQQLRIQNLEIKNSELTVSNTVMQPKADYFDELVDRNLLTNIRETAKQLRVGQKVFVNFLLDKKYLYRDLKGKLMPYAGKGDGLFEVKECFNDKTRWSGVQVLVTPKGREVFRLLCAGLTA